MNLYLGNWSSHYSQYSSLLPCRLTRPSQAVRDSWSSCFIWAKFVLSVSTPSLAMKCSCQCLNITFGSFASLSDSRKTCARFSSLSLPAMAEQKAAKAFPFENNFGSTSTGSAPSSFASGGGSLSYHYWARTNFWNIWMYVNSQFLRGCPVVVNLSSMTAATPCPDEDAIIRFILFPEFREEY